MKRNYVNDDPKVKEFVNEFFADKPDISEEDRNKMLAIVTYLYLYKDVPSEQDRIEKIKKLIFEEA